ncbi:intermembrane transport protein PqiB [Brenneria tiliae]|uniref:MlaD family protein n=1 Tax=Brenneria tiliae TaxID=2914984 RepID=A0ABT0MZ23_9GAMM|nr:MlaD family protein [Brenneria tiliae]MCL2895106.1 MlaD family protein [Brenneria tiliae]
MPSKYEQQPTPGEPVIIRRRWRGSLIWLMPAIAALIGIAMLIHAWISQGPEITISFQTASGLEAGKTAIKYKDVTVGIVESIALSDNSSRVVATVSLNNNAKDLARSDTRFWVVRPRIGAGGVSGIDTLLSGAYIGVDKGAAEQSAREFVGLETPPAMINGMPGRRFKVLTDDLGSLDIGSPVYYRRVQVGRIVSYQLADDGRSVNLHIFVDAPYDRFVTQDSHFWNASGIDVSLGADGFRLKTQTMTSIIAGGIAFASADHQQNSPPAADQATFTLAKDSESAMAAPDGEPIVFKLRFEQSLRGLAIGAPVEFSSIKVGRVVAIALDYSQSGYRFPTLVSIEVYPNRLGAVLEKLPKAETDTRRQTALFVRDMVAHGLRAQARAGNLLTGQLYVSLDFVPQAAKVPFEVNAWPLTIPTVNSGFEQLQEQLASIVGKIDKLPLESIGHNLDNTLADFDKTLRLINSQTLPEANRTLRQTGQVLAATKDLLAEDAPMMLNLQQTLQEMRRAMRSLRVFADLLERHPEALLRGRPATPSAAERAAFSPQGTQK